MHIKIQNAQWFNFLYATIVSADKKIALAHLYKAYDLPALCADVKTVVGGKKFHAACDGLWEVLGPHGCISHLVYDIIKLVVMCQLLLAYLEALRCSLGIVAEVHHTALFQIP